MSTNCLVTKLKSVVDNSKLLKIGEMPFYMNGVVSSAGQAFIRNVNNSPITLTPRKGNIYASTGAKPSTPLPLNTPYIINVNPDNGMNFKINLYWDAGEIDAIIGNYYDMATGNCSVEHFGYLNGAYRIGISSGKVSRYNGKQQSGLAQLSFASGVEYDTNVLDIVECCPAITELNISTDLTNNYILREVGNAIPTTITTLNLPFSQSKAYNVSGAIEDLVAAQVHKGRNSGNITFGNMNCPNVTFDDNSYGWISPTLAWSATGTSGQYSITYNNVTITISVDSSGNWTKVS